MDVIYSDPLLSFVRDVEIILQSFLEELIVQLRLLYMSNPQSIVYVYPYVRNINLNSFTLAASRMLCFRLNLGKLNVQDTEYTLFLSVAACKQLVNNNNNGRLAFIFQRQ